MFWIGLIIGCVVGSVITLIVVFWCIITTIADEHINEIITKDTIKEDS